MDTRQRRTYALQLVDSECGSLPCERKFSGVYKFEAAMTEILRTTRSCSRE